MYICYEYEHINTFTYTETNKELSLIVIHTVTKPGGMQTFVSGQPMHLNLTIFLQSSDEIVMVYPMITPFLDDGSDHEIVIAL